MLHAGDERGRTQEGNNNGYCQDNELSWLDWHLDGEQQDLQAFVREVIALRKAHPVFRRRRFFQGRLIKGGTVRDIVWLNPSGREMTDDQWHHSFARGLGVYLAGNGLEEEDEKGRALVDHSFLLMVSAHSDIIPFTIPAVVPVRQWRLVLDTSHGTGGAKRDYIYQAGESYSLQGYSLVLLEEAGA